MDLWWLWWGRCDDETIAGRKVAVELFVQYEITILCLLYIAFVHIAWWETVRTDDDRPKKNHQLREKILVDA